MLNFGHLLTNLACFFTFREYNDLTEEAIPNFNERRQRAELLDTMTGSNGEEEPYAVEQDIYDRDEVVVCKHCHFLFMSNTLISHDIITYDLFYT